MHHMVFLQTSSLPTKSTVQNMSAGQACRKGTPRLKLKFLKLFAFLAYAWLDQVYATNLHAALLSHSPTHRWPVVKIQLRTTVKEAIRLLPGSTGDCTALYLNGIGNSSFSVLAYIWPDGSVAKLPAFAWWSGPSHLPAMVSALLGFSPLLQLCS